MDTLSKESVLKTYFRPLIYRYRCNFGILMIYFGIK